MEKKKIGILMGGRSSEHEVSIMSGEEVYKFIDLAKYIPSKFLINKDGSFQFSIDELRTMDVVFLALHGKYGEDGYIQGFLETMNIPYTGPGVESSALGMDKYASRQLWEYEDLPTMPQRLVKSAKECKEFDLPYVLKPTSDGSSIGVTIVKAESQVEDAFNDAAKYGDVVLEKYIEGRELTVGVINDGGNLITLPITEIIPTVDFYDYEAKYIREDTKYIIPADLDRETSSEINEVAIEACKILKIDSYSRVDYMLDGPAVYLMEVNTLPGMTSHSLLPKAAEVFGISYTDLVTRIIEMAIIKGGNR